MIGQTSTDRRTFLGGTLAAGLVGLSGCTGSPAEDAASIASKPYEGKLGVQLYTVRDLFEQDYRTTLKAIADIGYKDCETAGFFEHAPADVKAAMDDLGLESHSAHVQLADMQDNFGQVLELAGVMGQTNLFIPWIAEELRNPDSYREIADLLNERAVEAKAAGMTVGYHNHEFEFATVDGERGYDILLQRTDPDLVKMELDMFWVAEADEDPLAVLEASPGRFIASHVKDRAADGTMVSVGDGTIDYKTILARAGELGMERFYIEHDNPEDPLTSIRKSFAHLAA